MKILRSAIDGQTAHVSVQFAVVEHDPETGQTTEGMPETVGIDHISLMRSFHGPQAPTSESIQAAIMRWLESHHEPALARKRAIAAVATSINGLKGRTLFAQPVETA